MSAPAIIPGVKPLTVVEADAHCSDAEMARRIAKTRADHAEVLQQYHDVWYTAPHTWHWTHFMGVGIMKCPNDLWMYQELMSAHRPTVVIETGTYSGASALWFAVLMDLLQIEGGHVYSIDFEDHRRVESHPRITFLGGDSTDPLVRDVIVDDLSTAMVDGPKLISLDADHSADHVRKELELYAPLTSVGDWLVVEDTNISWPGEQGDRGARGGVEDYLGKHPGEFRQDVLCERWLLTMNPGGWLRRVAACDHG
jgi:cephalosporin hydroxylase